MTRRLLLLLPFVPRPGAADAEDEVFELFTTLASRLSAGDAAGFLDGFDRAMPGYEQFRASVAGLLAQAEVQSSIEFRSNEGTDAARSVEIDWFLQIKERYETGAVTRRREIVKCRVEKAGRRWKVFSLEPQSLFAPVTVGA
jgi:hypothetical protein